MVALMAVAGAGIVIVAPAGARSGPSFAAFSANGSAASWRVNFTESGLTPKSKISYQLTAQASATFNCANAPSHDKLGAPHGAPQHFRVRQALTSSFLATVNAKGIVKRSNIAAMSFSAPTCSDGAGSALSSYALYNVRINDLTSHVHAPSLRPYTTPRPR
jgi:hypothetical protein